MITIARGDKYVTFYYDV